ncbi:hypothetical protein HQQ80_00730 [Microbacteriaceae bacterium VKM Ac-2855]|nr:hypothetical protein [Microbacteriaceae bacterium VKM Ac-2855]
MRRTRRERDRTGRSEPFDDADDALLPQPRFDAGFRPLRRLPDDIGGYLALDASGRSVLVEVIDAADGDEQDGLSRALRSLDRLEHPHIQRIMDLGDSRSGSLVLATVPAPSRTMAGLLARRRALDPGEIVTLIAPLVSALRHCHEHGVAHGAISAVNVALTEEGLPFLRGFSQSTLLLGRRDRRTLEHADLDALCTLARRCLGEDVPALQRPNDLDDFERALFAIATPVPVREDDAEPRRRNPDVRSAFDPAPIRAEPVDTAVRRRSRGRRGRRAERTEPEWPVRVAAVLAKRRGPILVGVCVVIAGGIALAAVPSGVAAEGGSRSHPTASRPASEAAAPPDSERASAAPHVPSTSDDPAHAVLELRSALLACAGQEPDCVDALLTADSPQRGTGITEWGDVLSAAPDQIRVVDRSGDAAVVAIGPPEESSSIVMIHSEGSWLFRDRFERS